MSQDTYEVVPFTDDCCWSYETTVDQPRHYPEGVLEHRQEPTQTEQQILSNLTTEQLQLVDAWLHEEAYLRASSYSQETCESIRYMGHRLEILAKDKAIAHDQKS